MGPAEIVASLKELCEEKGPRLHHRANRGVDRRHRGFESDAELIAFAKKMKARQYARMLEYEDQEPACGSSGSGASATPTGRRYYADILEMPDDARRRSSGSTRDSSNNCDPFAKRHGRLLRRPAILRLLHRTSPRKRKSCGEAVPHRERRLEPRRSATMTELGRLTTLQGLATLMSIFITTRERMTTPGNCCRASRAASTVPDALGRFGAFGGRFVPETLMDCPQSADRGL